MAGTKIALAATGAVAVASLALSGVALVGMLRATDVTVVKEVRNLSGREVMNTNVVCEEGRRAVGGSHAVDGAVDWQKPVTFPISRPESTSSDPGAAQNAWWYRIVNPMNEPIKVELSVSCAPIPWKIGF
ncbi:hypothetical protein ABT294_09185 [Nonomuraea sp. NPDC000554]|uniref:hypothetical protein n=1 Tax=Nonomuraea sp. NPDC000554 TaxID=3154259 RepID=UPI003321903C